MAPVTTVNGMAAVAIVPGRKRPADHPTVDRDLRRRHLDRHGNDPAQRVGDTGQPDLDVLGVAHHDRVGLDLVAVLLDLECAELR